MAEKRALVIGGVVVDEYLKPIARSGNKCYCEHLSRVIGGGGLGAARVLHSMGWHTTLLAALGNDSLAQLVVAELKKEGLDSAIQVVPNQPTGYSFIVGNEVFSVRGANNFLRLPGELRIDFFDLLYLASIPLVLQEEVYEHLKSCSPGKLFVFANPGALQLAHPRKLKLLLSITNATQLTEKEAQQFLGTAHESVTEILFRLYKDFNSIFIITCGEKGVWAIHNAELYFEPPCWVDQDQLTTTIGAGDAYGGAVAGALATGVPIATALKIGALQASCVLKRPMDAAPQFLTWDQITAFLAEEKGRPGCARL